MQKDRFSQQSDHYQRYRPGYPTELFQQLAALASVRTLAWDCGCGTGQASWPCASEFETVIATDLSWQQLSKAQAAKNIHYCVASADLPPLSEHSVDMILVAQALHWFDLPRFFAECERVLKPGGILAVLTYNLLSISAEIDPLIEHLYFTVLGDYWDAERRLVENAYADINFPFETESFPDSQMRCDWTCEQVLGYLGTWSAVKQFRKATGEDAISYIADDFRSAWGSEERKAVVWPLRCIVRRRP